MPLPTYTEDRTGGTRISPEITIYGGDVFPGASAEESATSLDISAINDELKTIFKNTDDNEGIIFEHVNDPEDSAYEQYLKQLGKNK